MGSPPPGTEKKGRVVSSHWTLAGLEVMIGQMKCEASHRPVCDCLQDAWERIVLPIGSVFQKQRVVYRVGQGSFLVVSETVWGRL